MNIKASFRSIASLKEWFLSAQKPFWTIWTGFSKDNKDLALRNSSISDLVESWNLLESIVSKKTEGGGRITVFVTEKENSSHGYTEFLEIAPLTSVAGISGISSPSGNYIGGVDQYISDRISMYEKDRQIEDLKAQLENKDRGSGINRVIDRILEEAPVADILLALLGKFMGTAPAPAVNGAPRITDDMEPEQLSDEENSRLHESIMRISVHFPDIASAMEKLADFVESNPDMAKSLLNKR